MSAVDHHLRCPGPGLCDFCESQAEARADAAHWGGDGGLGKRQHEAQLDRQGGSS